MAQRMVLVTCRRPFRPGLSSRMLCRSANSIGDTSAFWAISEIFFRYPLYSFHFHRGGSVFIWLAATRPLASWPEPSPLVSLNHGRCAGALAWVRTQMLCSAASVLMASISSRALLDSPPGAGAFIVTVAICTLLSKRDGVSSDSWGPGMGCDVPIGLFSRGIVIRP